MIQEVKKAIERMHRLAGMPRSEIVSASGGDAGLQHQLGHVLGAVIDVRFTPDVTKLLRSSEMTRWANKRHATAVFNVLRSASRTPTLTALRARLDCQVMEQFGPGAACFI